MARDPDILISNFVKYLSGRAGVRAVALVGSRGTGDPDKVDRYSDADFLVCCDDKELAYLLKGEWIASVEPPLLVFPQVMKDEMRILFDNLFACELHFLTVDQAKQMSGPCQLGSQIAGAMAIRYDPDNLLGDLSGRIKPLPPDKRDSKVTSSVFWYNVAYSANLILRGDLFRASHMANRYLQLFLLDLIFSIEEPNSTKNIARKLRPDLYEALTSTVSPLTSADMAAGLKRCMECYWRFQKEFAPDIDISALQKYHAIEQEVLRQFSAIQEDD